MHLQKEVSLWRFRKLIESYDFGRIVVDGETHINDLIIFPDHVDGGWWRKEGHRLHIKDIEKVIQAAPEVLVVGTGYSGAMKVPDKTRKYLEERGINLIVQPTKKASKTYNKLLQSGREAVAAFHLTC
ncbi:hypothetical protein GWO13_01395 [Candidatus Bathyarchaeota archaeon]|nr:hypothetical protein [Candidatus Bathyarchaeota archaeon]